MKNAFGSILILLLCSVVIADDPVAPTDTINTDNDCSTMGFVYARMGTTNYYNFIVVGVDDFGRYWVTGYIASDGSLYGNSGKVFWTEQYGEWFYQFNSTSLIGADIPPCAYEYSDNLSALTNEERQDIEALYDQFFPPATRYDPLEDADNDGMLDYYDLDCPRYQEYLQYCEDNGIEPLDLVDYQYFQDNEIDDWLAERNNMTDTDGDGFSDGYETIHGSEVYDGADYPLGVPDTGSSLLIVGGIDEQEPWRLEEYNDSGYSRGYVYDQGYDPFGTETLSFEDDPDWGLLDSDNDGLVNYAESANGTDPYRFEFQSGFSYAYDEEGGFYYVTGYTEDGAFGDYGNAPTEEEWLAAYEDYEVGDYAYNPSEYAFGDEKYDGLLDKTGKIKFNCDDVRPQVQRDYKVTFNLPIPGDGMQAFTVSVMPDTSTPAGAAMETVRQLIRGLSGVIFSYVFVKHVWLAIRQY